MPGQIPATSLELVDLPSLPASALQPLMNEEKARWLALLHWDFSPSAEMILRYAAMQALDGFALLDSGDLAGYVYFVCEDQKGLIGDLYVRDAWRSPANENRLLTAALSHLRRLPRLRRVEAQLMHLNARGSQVAGGGPAPAAYPRQFMLAALDSVGRLRPVHCGPELRLLPWSADWLDEAAELIALVYAGHVDSAINNQYQSAAGARRFLQNIVHYPGCGYFAPDCSWIAADAFGHAAGLCLASRIAGGAGHIAQLCLAPPLHGSGAGYELLRRAMVALASTGAREVSLTVTSSNLRAIRLYERCAFRSIHHFDALVWDPL